jgi:hypothetical protein
MSLKGLRVASKLALCASLALLTMGPLMAKDRSESSGPEVLGHQRAIHHFKKITVPGTYNQIFKKSTCTADCGDGTGFECSGPQTYCEDGLGCAASNGDITLIGVCGED